MIDASDHQRLPTARAELLAMLSEEELRGSKLLVFANKQDLPNALDEGQVGAAIGLNEIRDRQWSIWRCSAKSGEGLNEGLDWYAHNLPGLSMQFVHLSSCVQYCNAMITQPRRSVLLPYAFYQLHCPV